MPRLTDTLARRLRPIDRDQIVWCDRTPGFGVRVKPSGVATWIVDYRDAAGRKRRETLGSIHAWVCDEAREKAEALRRAVKPDDGPMTVRALALRYMGEHAAVRKKPRSRKEDQRLLDLHILPALGDRLVHKITRSEIATFAAQKAETPIQCNRMLALLSKAFTLAEVWGARPDGTNPTRGVARFPERRRERYLELDEWRRFWAALDEIAASPGRSQRLPTQCGVVCLRLILLTGARKTEAMTLERSWLDLDRGAAWLPDSKSGEKMLPLGAAAVDLLRAHLSWLDRDDRLKDCAYVFPGRRRGEQIGPIANVQDLMERARRIAGLADITIHGLRHSFGATAVDEGVDIRKLAAILGHSRIETTMIYAHARRGTVVGGADVVSRAIAGRIAPEKEAAPSPDESAAIP